MNLTTPEGVAEYMGQSTSDEDWDRRADEVKKANNGYPDFWFKTCIASGLHQRVSGSVPALSVATIDSDGSETLQGTYHAVTGEQIA